MPLCGGGGADRIALDELDLEPGLGGKDRLGHISKMGNGYLRRLLVVGATSVTRRAGAINTQTGAWLRSLSERKPARLVTVAIANKTARTAWALLAREESYRTIPAR